MSGIISSDHTSAVITVNTQQCQRMSKRPQHAGRVEAKVQHEELVAIRDARDRAVGFRVMRDSSPTGPDGWR